MDDVLFRAEQYQNLSIKKAQAHYNAADMFARRNVMLGAPVTVATSVVATSIFATLGQEKSNIAIMAITGSLSSAAAVLSGLQTFLRYSDQASAHRRPGVSYESVRRALDLFALEYRPSTDRAAALKALGDVAVKLDVIAEAEPTVPQYIYDRVKWTPALASDFSTAATPRPTS
jgi:hypothetical protein